MQIGPRWPRHTVTVVCFALFLALVAGVSPSAAQVQAPGPSAASGPSAADLQGLLNTIENAAEREKLASQLRALIAAQSQTEQSREAPGVGARVIEILAERVKEASDQVELVIKSSRDVGRLAAWTKEQFMDARARSFWLRLFLKLVAIAAAAALASWFANALLHRPRSAIEARATDSALYRIVFLLVRTLLDLVPLAVFGAVAYAVLPMTEPARTVRLVVTAFINAYLIAGGVLVLARMVVVPRISGLRLITADDETAAYLYIWVRRFTFVWVYGVFIAQAGHFIGLPAGGQRMWLNLIALLLAGMAVIFILQNRKPFADFLRGEGHPGEIGPFSTLRNRFADVWHALAIIYVVWIFAIWTLRIEDGFQNFLRSSMLSAVVVIVAILVSHAIRRGVKRGFSIGDDLRRRFPTLEARANRYLPVLDVTLRTFVYIVAVATLLDIWGFDVVGWITESAGRHFLSSTVSIVIVVIAALVLWEAVSAAIERYLERASEDTTALARRARARTLLPLLRNALFLTIAVMVVLVILSEIGINIGPLLAGAGIAGLAIGFGSQKLVQDVITGAFILFEDSVAVGDVVKVSGISGLVEAISLRSIRLRDLSGNVHTVPFSAVDTVTNMTKLYSYYVFDVGIAYRENVDDVIEVLRAIGAEMQQDPNFGNKILEPLEVLGLDSFADSAVIVKARLKTRPIEQWTVGREFNRRMKRRFDELGIEIPFPHRTIYMGELKDGTSPPLNVRTAEEGRPPASPVQTSSSAGTMPSRTPTESGQVEPGES